MQQFGKGNRRKTAIWKVPNQFGHFQNISIFVLVRFNII